MKQVIKQIIKNLFQLLGNWLLGFNNLKKVDEITTVNKGTQILLSLKYKELLEKKIPLPQLEEVEFRSFSQAGEDGILLYMFSLIGTTNKKAVEICGGNGITANITNLIVHHGWNGVFFEGNEVNVKVGKDFYSKREDISIWPPTFVHAWLTKENINTLISDNGFEGDIDLLSLDMDGVDYWIWQAIDCINPRVVVLEYMDILGPDKSVTVPYKPDFIGKSDQHGLCYGGASLPAFVKLGKQKGYRLVGCQRYGFNAFFIRSGIGEDIFPEILVSKCFEHPKAKYGIANRFEKVRNEEWIEV